MKNTNFNYLQLKKELIGGRYLTYRCNSQRELHVNMNGRVMALAVLLLSQLPLLKMCSFNND